MDVMELFKRAIYKKYKRFFLILSLLLLKFIFVRELLFEDIGIFQTIFVEIGYLLLILGLIELLPPKKIKEVLYLTINLILSVFLLVVLIYHDYFGYIVTFHAFSQLNQISTVKDSVLKLLTPVYLFLFIDFIFLLLFMFFRKKKQIEEQSRLNVKFVIPVILLAGALIAYNISSKKDANISDTVIAVEKQGIFTYEIIVARETPGKELSRDEEENLPKLINTTKGFNSIPKEELKLSEIAKDKNIIVIQVEALQEFPINLVVSGREITPFLNDLIKESLFFPNMFQQVGAGNTSDAEFIFNTSLYPPGLTAASTTFGKRDIPSMPKLLKEKGYTTLTFHANEITYWNRDQLYTSLGFDKYYDIEYFGNEDIIGIGPSDEYVYEKALTELKKLHDSEEKFYAQIVTLSSHHPFTIPSKKRVVVLPERFQGTLVGDYLKAISYTDSTIEKLVNDLKIEGMWENTLLVIYGDHFGLQPRGLKENDFKLLKELIRHDYTFLDQFNIPLIVSVGGQSYGRVVDTIGSQIDIMPTIANMIGLNLENFIHFGQDLVNFPNNLFGVRYYMPTGSFFNNHIAFKPGENFSDGEAYDVQTGKAISDFSPYKTDYNRIFKLLQLSDNYINSLPEKIK